MSVFSHNSLVRIAMEGHKSFIPGKISIDPQKQHTEAWIWSYNFRTDTSNPRL